MAILAELARLLASGTGETSRISTLANSVTYEDGQVLLASLAHSTSKFHDLRLALLLPTVRADALRKGIWLVQMKYFTSQEVVRLLPELHLALKDELVGGQRGGGVKSAP